MRETAGPERLKRLVQHIHALPTLPSMLDTLNRMMMDRDASAKEVARVISSDPALASKVLRVVNSSFYGFPKRITTVSHSIVILGFNTIKSIVLSSTIFGVFRKNGESTFDRAAFWKHSIGCGAAARVLARRLGHPATEEFFLAGLLHDVGKIVLDQYLPSEFAEIRKQVRERNCLLVEAEEGALGVTHAELGGWLFEKWNLSKGLVETVRCHHNPSLARDHVRTASVVHVADALVRAISFGNGGDGRMPRVVENAWPAAGVDPRDFDSLLRDVGQEIDRAMIFLDFIE